MYNCGVVPQCTRNQTILHDTGKVRVILKISFNYLSHCQTINFLTVFHHHNISMTHLLRKLIAQLILIVSHIVYLFLYDNMIDKCFNKTYMPDYMNIFM